MPPAQKQRGLMGQYMIAMKQAERQDNGADMGGRDNLMERFHDGLRRRRRTILAITKIEPKRMSRKKRQGTPILLPTHPHDIIPRLEAGSSIPFRQRRIARGSTGAHRHDDGAGMCLKQASASKDRIVAMR